MKCPKQKITIFQKKIVAFATMLILVSLCSCKNHTENVNKNIQSDKKDIVIFSTNDVNGAYDKYLGYAGLKTYIDKFDKNTNYVTLVDTGNFLSGEGLANDSKGKASIELIKKIGYDIVVPGSHEFDFGYDVFFENMNKIKDFVVSCNILDVENECLFFNPYKIINYGDVKVAYVGVTTPETFHLHDKNTFYDENGNRKIYFFEDASGSLLYEQIQAAVDDALNNGANKVILLCNLGNSNVVERWSSTTVIANTYGIDAVIDGHSKELIDNGMMVNKIGSFVPLVQAGTELKYIGAMNIMHDGSSYPAIISSNSINEKDDNTLKFINDLSKKYSK